MWYVNGLCRDVPFEITPDSADSCRVGYRTGIAVTPENDDLSDVRLTRHRGAGRNDTSSSSIVYYYKGAPVYPDARGPGQRPALLEPARSKPSTPILCLIL